jgi:hypothetical protein
MDTEHSRVINVVRFLAAAALLFGLALAISPAHAAPDATFVVDTTTDSNDVAYQACTAAADDCSLRGAITKANALAGADTITLPAGTYTLTLAGAGEDANASGDLDLTSDITLNGAGAATTIIDAGQLDRGLEVFYGASVTLDGVTLHNGKSPNVAEGHCLGGGVRNNGILTITNSVVSGNVTGNDGASGCNGGGVYNDHTLTIENSTISGNTAGDAVSAGYAAGHGGGVAGIDSTLTIRNSTISGNITGDALNTIDDGRGGGVYANGGTTTIENSTISGNAARGKGGGVENYDTSDAVTLIHVTVTDNTADSDADSGGVGNGGGLAWRSGAGAGFIVKNSLIAGNTDNGWSARDDCQGDSAYYTSQGYNLVGAGTGCPSGGSGDQTTSNAKLGPLQDNGGPTFTHAPQYDSPAVEVIPNGTNGCGSDYTTDQRGETRPEGGACDVGAYETPYIRWDGGGADDNTSTAGNWSGDVTPAASDVPVFYSLSSKSATLDTGLTVAGWLMATGYGGTISQGSRDLTVNGDWSQSAGSFAGGGGALDLGGGFDLSGGAFTAPSGLMIVSGIFDHSGGSFDPNGGHVVLGSTSNQTLASAFYDLTINDGLIGYWKLDEGSGATTADASGYGHAGALYNSPVWNTSTPATMDFHDPYSLGFDRSGSAKYVLTGNIPKLDQAQNLTLSAWVRLASTPGGSGLTYMRFITLENEKAVLRYTDEDGTGKLQFYMRIGGSTHAILVDQAWATNTWYHVAGTYDGSTMRLYLDGIEQDTLDIAGAADSGGWVRLSHSGSDEALDGLLDDVRIYDRALSPTEIYNLAQGKHPRTSLATTTLGDALDVNGTLTLNSGTLDVSGSNYAINLAGDLTRNGGVFTAQNGTVTFDGSVTQTLDTDDITFYDVIVNSGATLLTQRSYTANGTVTNNGTLQLTKNVASGQVGFLGAGGYGGVSIATAGDLGAVTVTIKGNQDCTTVPGETVRRCFDIAPTNTDTAQVLFYFSGSELSGNDCNTLNAYHWDGNAWQLLPLDTSWGGDGRACESEPYSVRVYPVSDFSPFVLSDEEPGGSPTTVTLASFTATAVDDGVLLEWQTASEVDLLGFHLYRAETADGPQTRLNADLIPGQAPGSPVGGIYEFVDEAVAPGVTYYYWLEGVDIHGRATRHGPVSAQASPGSQYRIYLPLMSR